MLSCTCASSYAQLQVREQLCSAAVCTYASSNAQLHVYSSKSPSDRPNSLRSCCGSSRECDGIWRCGWRVGGCRSAPPQQMASEGRGGSGARVPHLTLTLKGILTELKSSTICVRRRSRERERISLLSVGNRITTFHDTNMNFRRENYGRRQEIQNNGMHTK